VGTVHLGVAHLLELEEPLATAREAAISDAGFAPLNELAERMADFETWSQFILSHGF
jgi:predicted NUDIX family phosphoesterase